MPNSNGCRVNCSQAGSTVLETTSSPQPTEPMPAPLRQLLLLGCLASAIGTAQSPANAQWVEQKSSTQESFRGLSAVDSGIIWASGTHGTFMWSSDGGARWHVGMVPGATSLDFRAVHAVSVDTAFVMAAGQDTARIYRTTDRGIHWTLQYDDTSKGAFLDGIAFFDSRHGLALGDPVGGRFVLLRTSDAGANWVPLPDSARPRALANEAAFAASGTSLVTCGPHDAWFATGGGAVARVFRTRDSGRSWQVADTPVRAGNAAAGIFSLACRDRVHGIATGGNYAHPDSTAVTVALTNDRGATWTAAVPSSATAYISGVAYLDTPRGRQLVGVGTAGTALSLDGGTTWRRVDSLSLNVVVSPSASRSAFAAGAHGLAVRWAAARLAARSSAPACRTSTGSRRASCFVHP